MTAGVAMLSLYSWLLGMKRRLLGAGRGYLPLQLAIVTDKGKGAKEQGNLVVKEAVSAILAGWRAPFRHALQISAPRSLSYLHPYAGSAPERGGCCTLFIIFIFRT